MAGRPQSWISRIEGYYEEMKIQFLRTGHSETAFFISLSEQPFNFKPLPNPLRIILLHIMQGFADIYRRQVGQVFPAPGNRSVGDQPARMRIEEELGDISRLPSHPCLPTIIQTHCWCYHFHGQGIQFQLLQGFPYSGFHHIHGLYFQGEARSFIRA